MKKIALLSIIAGLIPLLSLGQDDQPLSLDFNNRPLIAQELKALSSIARESVRDIQEKYRSFKERIEQITQETDTAKQLSQLIHMVEPTAQVLVQEWSKIGYQAGELLDALSSLAINETETQKIKEIAGSLKTASRDFDEFKNLIQTKVFPIIEQNLEQLKTQSVSTVAPETTQLTEEPPLEPVEPVSTEPSIEEPTEQSTEPEISAEPALDPALTEEQPSTELPTPPVEEIIEPTLDAPEPALDEESMQTESAIEEPTPTEEPSFGQMIAGTEPESPVTPTQMSTEFSPAQEISKQIIDEEIDNLPGSAPEIAQLLDKGKIEGVGESELKNLLEQRDKDFGEKFPGPEFLAFIGDLNILHAYAKATRDYVDLAKHALEKQDKESVTRIQEKIDDTKQKYVNKINEINERYRSTEWYAFYTQ